MKDIVLMATPILMGMPPIPPISRAALSHSRVIARGKNIRIVKRLVKQYGGKAKNWVKKSGPPEGIHERLAERHWYEHHGIGRVEEKIKWLE